MTPSPLVAVGILAKPPVPGFCKTRLCPPLTPVQAAELYHALLEDTVALALRTPGTRVTLFAAPEQDGTTILQHLFPSVRVLPQRGADLGARMFHALATLLTDDGADAALVLGADAPLVPLAEAVGCAAWLTEDAEHRAFAGPTQDGGYWTLGMAHPHPVLFRDVAWSTPLVLATTQARSAEAGLTLRLISSAQDVDDGDDLRRLRVQLQDGSVAPATSRWLQSTASAG